MKTALNLILPLAVGLYTALSLAAQEQNKPRTLEDLDRSFRKEWQQARAAGGEFGLEQARVLVARHTETLRSFLDKEARGVEVFNGRLMLADLFLAVGRFKDAKEALGTLDAAACPAAILLNGAAMAKRMRLPVADQWKQQALAKDAPFLDRMGMARLLMTVLEDAKAGEAIFAAARAAARDDEERARVDWFRALTWRAREDVPEEQWVQELEKLAKALPETRYGRIARDRVKVLDLRPGADPLTLGVADTAGKPVEVADFRGRVLLLFFGLSKVPATVDTARVLAGLAAIHGDQGLDILHIALDEDRKAARAFHARTGLPGRLVCDGLGWDSDLVLRYGIESVPHLLLIGRDGKIAATALYASTPAAREALTRSIKTALGSSGN